MQVWISIFCLIMFQAEILARYKPTIDTETMIPKLRHSEQLMADSLRFFNTTHHIIVYYEDILKNQEVNNQCNLTNKFFISVFYAKFYSLC